MKKILIFSVAYHPFVGGAEVAIKEITDRISLAEIEFDMVTLRYNSELPRFEKIGNVNVYRIGVSKKNPSADELVRFPMYLNKVFFPFTALFKAISLYKKNKYDCTWAIMSYMGFPALFFKWFRSVPFILTLQEGDTIEHVVRRKRIRMVGLLYKQIFKKAEKIQAISNYLAEFARSMGTKAAVRVIPNGVDIDLFTEEPPKAELSELWSKLGKEADDIYLITSSRLVIKNGIEDVIKAMAYLPKNVKFLILGTGQLSAKLKNLCLHLNLQNRVQFLGFVSHDELPKYLKIADIFIRPSLSEGMGNSFIEAMAVKKPVIGTLVGGIPDFLIEDKTGFVCKPNDPRSIANAVKRIMQLTPKEYIEITERAYELAVEKYDWNLIAAEMKERFF